MSIDASASAAGSSALHGWSTSTRCSATGGGELVDYGELCMCAITRMEILYSARSADDFATLQEDLSDYRDLRIDHATISAAEAAQRELADAAQHRVSLPDLVIGACAQRHRADVLHVDRHFDGLAGTLGFRSIRLR